MEIAANGKPIESAWAFPRPPRLELVEWRVRVVHAGTTLVDAPHVIRILETSQPPAYYVADEFVDLDLLEMSARRTFCEWKGVAEYAHIVSGDERVVDACWTYPSPSAAFEDLRDHWAFYAQKADECWIDDECVTSNEGSFYGGWVTDRIVGPWKGAPGSGHW